MAMVNVQNLLNVKDSRWLQLEVCREFQRNKCTRPDTECKFAHPPANVEVQNGKVTACYDSIKGRCNREKPPCKYFHPPQHLKDQLLINGRNHLALKNALMQQIGLAPGQAVIPGQMPTAMVSQASPYMALPQVGSYSPYMTASPVMPIGVPSEAQMASPVGVMPQTVIAPQKVQRTDRLESVTAALDPGKKRPRDLSDDVVLAFPGMVSYAKRSAGDKSGVPMYQPTAAYQQALMQLQQPPVVPVSCEYLKPAAATVDGLGSGEEAAGVGEEGGSDTQESVPSSDGGGDVGEGSGEAAAASKTAAALKPSAQVALNYTGIALNKQMPVPTLTPQYQQQTHFTTTRIPLTPAPAPAPATPIYSALPLTPAGASIGMFPYYPPAIPTQPVFTPATPFPAQSLVYTPPTQTLPQLAGTAPTPTAIELQPYKKLKTV